jgi:hypothetical protein
MRSHRRTLTAVGLIAAAAALLGLSVPAATAAPTERWHAAEVLSPPRGSYGNLAGIACTSASSCVAGGSYYSASRSTLPMIAAESAGKWGAGRSIRLPANALSGVDQSATVASVACSARTSCVTVGSYDTAAGLGGFIASGHGRNWGSGFSPAWPKGTVVPAVGYLTGLSCTGRGTCVAVGGYDTAAGGKEPMVVAESRGRWGRAAAIRPPSNAAANPDSHLTAISCPKAGECVAVGWYTTKSSQGEALAVAQTKGRWGRATQIQLPPVKVEPSAELFSVSCVKPGSCVAVGSYVTGSGATNALGVAMSGGHWRRGVDLTMLPSGAAGGGSESANLNGVSCASSSCLAVGQYLDNQNGELSMAISESRGKWGHAIRVGLPPRAAGGSAQLADLFAIACLRSGSCTAVGDYTSKSKVLEAMAATRAG